MGRRGVLDMLNVGYTAGVYLNKTIQDCGGGCRISLCALDRGYAHLLDEIDKKVGLANGRFLTSTGYFKGSERVSPVYNTFRRILSKRAVSLLNVYLMALYGQRRDWVIGYPESTDFLEPETD